MQAYVTTIKSGHYFHTQTTLQSFMIINVIILFNIMECNTDNKRIQLINPYEMRGIKYKD